VSLLDGEGGPALADAIANRIVRPTLAAMRERGTPFSGLLYAGLMLTDDGPKVVEFNCRFGDPETQAVLPFFDACPIGELCHTVAAGGTLQLPATSWATAVDAAVTTVLAASGYPEKPRTGDPITLPHTPPDVHLFHAGTALDAAGRLVTAGGRVLAVTALGETFEAAQALSREYAERVEFEGKHFRTDIGWREAARRGPW
jgi:phosphoribosylamine--glycine ligase